MNKSGKEKFGCKYCVALPLHHAIPKLSRTAVTIELDRSKAGISEHTGMFGPEYSFFLKGP